MTELVFYFIKIITTYIYKNTQNARALFNDLIHSIKSIIIIFFFLKKNKNHTTRTRCAKRTYCNKEVTRAKHTKLEHNEAKRKSNSSSNSGSSSGGGVGDEWWRMFFLKKQKSHKNTRARIALHCNKGA